MYELLGDLKALQDVSGFDPSAGPLHFQIGIDIHHLIEKRLGTEQGLGKLVTRRYDMFDSVYMISWYSKENLLLTWIYSHNAGNDAVAHVILTLTMRLDSTLQTGNYWSKPAPGFAILNNCAGRFPGSDFNHQPRSIHCLRYSTRHTSSPVC